MSTKRKIDPDELRRFWAGDIPVWRMAAHFKCSESAVHNTARSLGLPHRKVARKNAQQPIDEADFKRMWANGVPVAEMAEEFGVSRGHISSTAGLLGLPPRLSRSMMLSRDQVQRAIDSGTPVAQLARDLGCHENTLRNAMARMKVEPPEVKRQREEAARRAAETPKPQGPDLSTITGRLLATKGRWEALEVIRKERGWTPVQVQQQFHRARSGT